MDIFSESQKIVESIIRGKEMKEELSNQIDTVNDQEFFDLVDAIDNNSKIELPNLSDSPLIEKCKKQKVDNAMKIFYRTWEVSTVGLIDEDSPLEFETVTPEELDEPINNGANPEHGFKQDRTIELTGAFTQIFFN